VVLHQVGFGLEAGDRVALLGPNGAGKSTLVKSLVGELPPLAGERIAHGDLRIGYFAQHTVESLRDGASPIDHLRDIAPDASTVQEMRNFLGRWYFSGDRAFEVVDHFSGGERARLALALLAWRNAQRAAARRADQPPGPGHARGAGRGAGRFRWCDRPGLARPSSDRPGLRHVLARGRRRVERSAATWTSTRPGCGRTRRQNSIEAVKITR
jgi:hypothetical protein